MRLPVRFDDRLRTVLGQNVRDSHDRAVRWRQLVDLVARAGASDAAPLISEALAAIRADLPQIDEKLRAAAARAIAGLPLPAELVAIFASDGLAVSAPVLAGAKLTADQWRMVIANTDAETRRFVAAIHPDAGVPADQGSGPGASAVPSISDVVARVERVRRSRDGKEHGVAPSQLPPPAQGLFRWECGPSGEITWVEGVPRGPLIGRSIARSDETAQVDHEVERAFAMRGPFRDAPLSLAGEGPAAGKWKISGVPAFEPADGRFAGYRGIALREGVAERSRQERVSRLQMPDPDTLRELVHEIKTPLNAIIGFAEIIDGQYLGPADRRYRLRASEIVRQAKLLLTAIDDLDFAARLQSDPAVRAERTDLAVLLAGIADRLRQHAASQGSSFDLEQSGAPVCAVDAALAERIVSRLATSVIDAAGEGDKVTLRCRRSAGRCLIELDRPRALRGAELLDGNVRVKAEEGADSLGLAFSLRLVRGLVRIAGGDLVMMDERLLLSFPEA